MPKFGITIEREGLGGCQSLDANRPPLETELIMDLYLTLTNARCPCVEINSESLEGFPFGNLFGDFLIRFFGKEVFGKSVDLATKLLNPMPQHSIEVNLISPIKK